MIGFDLQEVEKIFGVEEALLNKIALEGEIDYIQKFKCDFTMRVATLWAVKEAAFKALDVSEGDISYKEIELSHKPSGRPVLTLYGKAKARFEALGGKEIDVSCGTRKASL